MVLKRSLSAYLSGVSEVKYSIDESQIAGLFILKGWITLLISCKASVGQSEAGFRPGGHPAAGVTDRLLNP